MRIITLTLSPAFDLHCTAQTLAVHHENLATVTESNAGGKGINISRALAAFGIDSTAVAILGEENGASFARAVRADGIRLLEIPDRGRIRENITLHTADGGETRLSFTGAPASPDALDRVRTAIEGMMTEDTVLTVTGRVPEGISLAALKEMILRFRSVGVKTVVDSRSFSPQDLLEVSPYLIKPNEEEIEVYAGHPVTGAEEALAAARRLYDTGIENVMVTLGKEGAVLVSRDGVYRATPPAITPLSTIGAGDSSIAGFLMGMALGERTEACLKRAVAFGTAACLTSGTRAPSREAVADFLRQISVARLDR